MKLLKAEAARVAASVEACTPLTAECVLANHSRKACPRRQRVAEECTLVGKQLGKGRTKRRQLERGDLRRYRSRVIRVLVSMDDD